jgi:cytoskeletal protein CcmA (bactofilin family)
MENTTPKAASLSALPGAAANTREAGNLVIGAGVTFQGNISNAVNVSVFGTLNGQIETQNLFTGTESRITGKVKASNATIQGQVDEEISIQELLHLESTAVVNGNLTVGALSAKVGSRINGTIAMRSLKA